jgi:hypothetical protein
LSPVNRAIWDQDKPIICPGIDFIDLHHNELQFALYSGSISPYPQGVRYFDLYHITRATRVKKPAENSDENYQISFGQLLLSTLSAFIGVQSNANRERDFKHGKISHFIFIGLLFGLVFILTIVAVVNLVMSLSGG